MVSLQAICPNCQKRYRVSERNAGKTVDCRQCGERFQIRSPNAPREPSDSSAAPVGSALDNSEERGLAGETLHVAEPVFENPVEGNSEIAAEIAGEFPDNTELFDDLPKVADFPELANEAFAAELGPPSAGDAINFGGFENQSGPANYAPPAGPASLQQEEASERPRIALVGFLGLLGGVFIIGSALVAGSLIYRNVSSNKQHDRVPDPRAAFSVADIAVPDLSVEPKFSAERDFSPANIFFVAEVELGIENGAPGYNDRLLILQPELEPEAPLPCVFIAPGGATIFTGIKYSRGDLNEYAQLVLAGFTVVIYEIDGELPSVDPSEWTMQQVETAYNNYLESQAGLVNARNAVDYALEHLSVDAERLYTVGHSSGGKQALLLASHDDRLDACAALAGPTDLLPSLNGELKPILGEMPRDLPSFIERASPSTHIENINCPVLLLHGQDDNVVGVGQSADFAEKLRELGKQVDFKRFARLDHFDIVEVGISDVVDWLKSDPKHTKPGLSVVPEAPYLPPIDGDATVMQLAATQSYMKTYRLPGSTYAASFDRKSGHLAIGHDKHGVLIYDLRVFDGDFEPIAQLPINGPPSNVCFRAIAGQTRFLASHLHSRAVSVFDVGDYSQLKEVPPPDNISEEYSIAHFAVSENPHDPYVLVSWRKVDSEAGQLPEMVSRIHLKELTHEEARPAELKLPSYSLLSDQLKNFPLRPDAAWQTSMEVGEIPIGSNNALQVHQALDTLQIALSLGGDVLHAPLLKSAFEAKTLSPPALIQQPLPNTDAFDRFLLGESNLSVQLSPGMLTINSVGTSNTICRALTPIWEKESGKRSDPRQRNVFRASHFSPIQYFNAFVDLDNDRALLVTDETLRVIDIDYLGKGAPAVQTGWDLPLFTEPNSSLKFTVDKDVTAIHAPSTIGRTKDVEAAIIDGKAELPLSSADLGVCRLDFEFEGAPPLSWETDIRFRPEEVMTLPMHASGFELSPEGRHAIVWGRMVGTAGQGWADATLAVVDLDARRITAHKEIQGTGHLAILTKDAAFVACESARDEFELLRLDINDLRLTHRYSIGSMPTRIESVRDQYLIACFETPQYVTRRFNSADLTPLDPFELHYSMNNTDGTREGGLAWQGVLWSGEPLQRQLLVDLPSREPKLKAWQNRLMPYPSEAAGGGHLGTRFTLQRDSKQRLRVRADKDCLRAQNPFSQDTSVELVPWQSSSPPESRMVSRWESRPGEVRGPGRVSIVELGGEELICFVAGEEFHLHPLSTLFPETIPRSTIRLETAPREFFLSPRKNTLVYKATGATEYLLQLSRHTTLLREVSQDGVFTFDLSDHMDKTMESIGRSLQRELEPDGSIGDRRKLAISKIAEANALWAKGLGRELEGFPLEVTADVYARSSEGEVAHLRHSFLIELPIGRLLKDVE